MSSDVVWLEFVDRRRAGMIHALDGGLWFHQHVWRGERMAHLVSSSRELLLAAGHVLGLPARGLQYKPLKDPRTGVRVEAWHWDLRGPYYLKAAGMVRQPAGNGSGRPAHSPNVDRRSKATDGMRVSVILLASSLAILGCDEGGFFNEDELDGTAGRILASDTTLLQEEAVTYNVEVEYPFGNGAPREYAWFTSDTTIVSIQGVFTNGTVTASARGPGTAMLSVLLNERFYDTVAIEVVAPGTVRWRQSLGGDGNTPALDTTGNVFVIERGTTAMLRAFTGTGAPIYGVPSCGGLLAPAVSDAGSALAAGFECIRQHDAAGVSVWTTALGDLEGGAALTTDGGAVLLHTVGTVGAGAVVVSRFTSLGAESWRDTLESSRVAQSGAPAIGFGQEIYVSWQASDGGDSLTRIQPTGAIRWTRPLPNNTGPTTPAIRDDRVYVAFDGGLIAHDTAGTMLWDRRFNAVNPNAPASTRATSPVLDGPGNIYVQNTQGLHSYAADGTSRWVADTLGGPVLLRDGGAPTILLNGSLVVACGGEVCSVRSNDGSLVWRSAVGGGVVGSPAVNEAGTLFVIRSSPNELVALWGRALPVLSTWSTEGGGMGRGRRER